MRVTLLAAATLLAGDCADVEVPKLGDSEPWVDSEPPTDTGPSAPAETGESGDTEPPGETGESDVPDDTGPSPAHMYGLAYSHAQVRGTTASSSAGLAVAIPGDVDGDGFDDLLVGTTDAGSAAGSGTVYLLAGPLDGDLVTDDAIASLGGVSTGQGAYRLCAPGDLNLDGLADVVVGAPGTATNGANSGAVYLAHGPLEGELSLADADKVLLGEQAGDEAGHAVEAADLDGDGTPDLAIGAPGCSDAGSGAGATYLFLGPPSALETMSDATVTLRGSSAGERAGVSLAGGADVDGDGLADLIVGAPGTSSGKVYLVLLASNGVSSLADADAVFVGEDAADQLGAAVTGLDFDGDGYGDLALGAPDNERGGFATGTVYVVPGGSTASAAAAAAAGWILTGGELSDLAGSSLAALPEAGESGDALLIGAPAYDQSRGQVYLVRSASAGTSSLAYTDIRFVGEDPGNYVAHQHGSLGGGGDLTGDGVDDWVVGAFGLQGDEGQVGAVYVWSGADP